METRKLQKTGGSTYTVSLPKYWVTSSKLKEGDPVAITIDNSGLLSIDPTLGGRRPTAKVEVFVEDDETPHHFLRKLIGLYITGYFEMVIRSKTRIQPDIRKAVRDFTRRVIGPQIVDESGVSITIQDVADHSHLDMRKILKRMHLMSRSMHADAMEALAEGNPELAGDVVTRDDEVDRLYWFISKQQSMMVRDPVLARKMGVSLTEASFYLQAAKAMERIADHAARIAMRTQTLSGERVPEKVLTEMHAYSEMVTSVLDRSIESLLKRDLQTANQVVDEAEQIRSSREPIIKLLMEQKGKAAVPLALMIESLERTALYSADIAEIAINLGCAEHE
ncbi:MAG: hypothetical protein MUE55_04815 [Thermoplasmata archaeon]|jgi:phosphate uptake regulator|nr:hypothetical protein [Thermoplasmata archaeon]